MVKALVWLFAVLIVWLFAMLLTPTGWKAIAISISWAFDSTLRTEAALKWMTFSQMINKFFDGNPATTISGRVGYRAISLGLKKHMIKEKVINWVFGKDHCFKEINWALYDPKQKINLIAKYYGRAK